MAKDLNMMAARVLVTLWYMEETEDPPIDEIVNGIFGLASTIKKFDGDDFIIHGENDRELKVESATGYLVDRLHQAYADKRIREQYLEELQSEERWELLAKIH